MGDGLAMGFGVMSHALALPGHLARSLSSVTGRGAIVDVLAEEDTIARSLADRFEAASRAHYDAVVLMFGITDAIQLTSLEVWRRGVRAFVDRAAGVGSPVLLVALPPIRRLPSLKGFAARVIQRHAALFNRELLRISKQSSTVTYLPFNPPAEQDLERHRSSKTYQAWAALIVPALAQVLSDN
jgi:lysophospholipase L1-like esterase